MTGPEKISRSHLHVKFDLANFNLITFFLTKHFNTNFTIYAKVPKEFDKTYILCIIHTEKEIDTII